MTDFKRNNKFGGGGSRGGGGFNKRPSFGGSGGGNRFGGGRDSGRELELFKATCAECSKVCEVPFRPNGKKPVYCKECFATQGGSEASRDFAPRRDYERKDYDRESARPAAPTPISNGGTHDLRKQVEAMNSKLDRLIELMATMVPAERLEIPLPTPKRPYTRKKK